MPNARRISIFAMQRLGLALAVGIVLGFGVEKSAQAQTPADTVTLSDSARAANLARIDSLFAQIDTLLARTKVVPSIWTITVKGDNGNRDAAAYAGMISAGLVVNWFARIDKDPCPSGARVCLHGAYHDSFTTPDKLGHLNAAYFLTSSAMNAGVPPKWAAGLTCGLAGVGFEVSQGFVSWKDITADCVGSGLAVVLRNVGAKAKAAGWLHR